MVAIRTSSGAAEFGTESLFETHDNHPRKAVTVSSGDNGFGAEYPAASQFVTAVGGTGLNRSTNARAGARRSGVAPEPGWDGPTGNGTPTEWVASSAAHRPREVGRGPDKRVWGRIQVSHLHWLDPHCRWPKMSSRLLSRWMSTFLARQEND